MHQVFVSRVRKPHFHCDLHTHPPSQGTRPPSPKKSSTNRSHARATNEAKVALPHTVHRGAWGGTKRMAPRQQVRRPCAPNRRCGACLQPHTARRRNLCHGHPSMRAGARFQSCLSPWPSRVCTRYVLPLRKQAKTLVTSRDGTRCAFIILNIPKRNIFRHQTRPTPVIH